MGKWSVPRADASRRVAPRWLAIVAFAAFLAPRGSGPLVAKAELAKLESAARELASKGREAEMSEVLEVLAVIGEDAGAITKTRETCVKSLAKVKTPASGAALATVAHSLHSTADEMSRELATLAEQDRGTLAEQILRLDDEQPAAHQTLSHVQENGKWISAERKLALERRRAIQAALAQSRKLEIPLEIGLREFAALKAIDPAIATSVKFKDLEFISTMPETKLVNIVRRTLQAFAFSNWLRGRQLEVPTQLHRTHGRLLLLTTQESYLKSIDLALAAKGLKSEDIELTRQLAGYHDGRGFFVECSVSEVHACAQILLRIGEECYDPFEFQPCLVGGHLNWLCLTCLGTNLPGLVQEKEKPGAAGGVTTDRPRDLNEEKQARELARAGISGARRWLVFKAARGEDPAWSRGFVDRIEKLVDLDLLKSTFVVEYLQELGRFDDLLTKTTKRETERRTRTELIESQIPEGLPAFEQRFHAWLLPKRGGVVQRLAQAPPEAEKPSKDEQAALAELDRVRKAAWDDTKYGPYTPLTIDRSLSDGCALHVRYLKLHPAQLEKWPDAHEEYPDQEGFSADGCWSGMHSVIAPGVTTADDAITAWMGTFYHRLPLLEPGLKRIGFALADRTAVLDADSMVEPDDYEGCILWPPRDMKNVPTHFAPELPNPVPGADERTFGYPITLQTTHKNLEFRMKLVRGPKPEGPETPCWCSTPGHPTYLDLAPPDAFCLIPKSPLEPGTKYTVVAEPDGPEKIVWSFTTGH